MVQEKKMFFVLSWPLFHKLEMIQRKIKFKKFISAVAKSSDSLSCSKGCSQFSQPNLFVLMVGDRLPGVGWANSSRDQTRGWEGWGSSFSHALCEEPQRGTQEEVRSLWSLGLRVRGGANQDTFHTSLAPSPLPSDPKGSEKAELGEKKRRGRREKREWLWISGIVTLLIQ